MERNFPLQVGAVGVASKENELAYAGHLQEKLRHDS